MKLLAFSTISKLWQHIKEYPVEGASLGVFFYTKEDGIDASMTTYDLDTLSKQQYNAIRGIILKITHDSLRKKKLDDPLTVFRSGNLSEEVVSVSLNIAASKFFGTPIVYTIPQRKVLVDVNGIKRSSQQFTLEEELLVYSKDLKKT